MGLQDKINALNQFKLNINEYIQNEVISNEFDIVYMNAELQLNRQGINRDGIDIMSYAPYAPLTVSIKLKKQQPTTRVTLKDTGAFHSSFAVVAGNDSFKIEAYDTKTRDLIAKYGESILGLTDENLSILARDTILPKLRDRLKSLL